MREDGLDEIGCGIEHVLAVVDHQQPDPALQRDGHRLADGFACLLGDAQHRRQRIRHRCGFGDRGQFEKPSTVWKFIGQVRRDFLRQARLADPTHAGQRDQPMCSHGGLHLSDRVYTSDNTWVGGRSEDKSYFSGYPETREIYLQEAWELDEDGVFERPIPRTAGVWIRCDDAQFVQFLKPGEVAGGSQSSEPGDADGGGYAGDRLVALLPLGKGRKLRVSVTDGA